MAQPSLELCEVDPGDGFQYLSSYQNVSRWKNRNRWKKSQNYFFLTNFLMSYFKTLPEKLFFSKKRQFFHFFSLNPWNHIHTCSSVRDMSFRYHGNFWMILSRVPSYIATYKNSGTNRAQKKGCFLSILQISNHSSVARCCLNVDFYLSCHKHTPKLLIALSRVSKNLLDRFLDRKTWFFVFSNFYARCVTKGLMMSAPQLSSKMLENLKELSFFRKV